MGAHSIENNFDLIDQAITDLEKEGKTKLALNYMKVAHDARLYQNTLGVDQFV